MPKFVIHETTYYYDAYEVEAETLDEAVVKHRTGESLHLGPSMSEGEITEIVKREEE